MEKVLFSLWFQKDPGGHIDLQSNHGLHSASWQISAEHCQGNLVQGVVKSEVKNPLSSYSDSQQPKYHKAWLFSSYWKDGAKKAKKRPRENKSISNTKRMLTWWYRQLFTAINWKCSQLASVLLPPWLGLPYPISFLIIFKFPMARTNILYSGHDTNFKTKYTVIVSK